LAKQRIELGQRNVGQIRYVIGGCCIGIANRCDRQCQGGWCINHLNCRSQTPHICAEDDAIGIQAGIAASQLRIDRRQQGVEIISGG